MKTERILPHSEESEKGLLGSMFIAPSRVIPEVAKTIKAEDFYLAAHGEVFTLLKEMQAEGAPIDLITVTARLRSAGALERCGGPGFVSEIYSYVPTESNAPSYAGTVAEKARLRALIEGCREIAVAAYGPDSSLDELGAKLTQLTTSMAVNGPEKEVPFKELLTEALERYEKAQTERGSLNQNVIPTYLEKLDDTLSDGMHRKDLVVIGGYTSSGKTALAMQLTHDAAVERLSNVLIVSYEMSRDQLVDRIISRSSGVAANRLRGGLLTERDYANLSAAVSRMVDSQIFVRDDVSSWTVFDIASEARAIKVKYGLDMLVVDYAQLVAGTKGKDNREQQVAEITRVLKGLAKELDIIIIVLSQLNEEGKLRESRALGHDADVVLIVEVEKAEPPSDDNKIIFVEKNRHGQRHLPINVSFHGPTMTFTQK